ncbi:MAG TPA: hypothetical protein VHH11_13990 [Gammaproteobacteria bacterium]|nr:hypothetical protein [Gammaproteobacteria bacterium]
MGLVPVRTLSPWGLHLTREVGDLHCVAVRIEDGWFLGVYRERGGDEVAFARLPVTCSETVAWTVVGMLAGAVVLGAPGEVPL